MQSRSASTAQNEHRVLRQLRIFNRGPSGVSYVPLNENRDEIRLLNILPNSETSTLIQCKLITVSLKDLTPEYHQFLSISNSAPQNKRDTITAWARLHPPTTFGEIISPTIMDKYIPSTSNYRFVWGDYAALSYVWGDPKITHTIMVNGEEMQVGRNLEIALRALSARPDFQDGFKIWVDAICINQNDMEERGRQVNKMREIYGRAWAVIAWIGEEQDNSNEAIQLLQSLSQVSVHHADELATRLSYDPEFFGYGCWVALQDLMNREYWKRLWVIQELVLGSPALVLRCGERFIDWTSFCNGISILYDYLWNVKDELFHYELHKRGGLPSRPAVWRTASLHLIHQDLWALSLCPDRSEAYLRFDRLLNVANTAISRDPRDKVYGLIGMMDPRIAMQLVPNYELPPSVVYASIAKLFITTYGNLEPLREGNPWSRSNTPSWAADWTWTGRLRHRSPEKNDLWGPFWTRKGDPEMVEAAIPYRASGEIAPEGSISDDGLQLTCRGFIIDKIAGLGARGKGYFKWPEDSIVQPDQENNAYATASGVSQALSRALVADRVAEGLPATDRHLSILNLPSSFASGHPQFQRLGWKWLASQGGYYFRWEKFRFANRHFRLMGRPLNDYFSDQIPDDASEYDYTEVYSCYDRTCKGRRLMTTANGYLGWAPDNITGDDEAQTKKGDLIAIVFGCSTPLVIRPCRERFQVVGEAYVQGLMDGEGLELMRTGQCSVQDFTFC